MHTDLLQLVTIVLLAVTVVVYFLQLRAMPSDS